MYWLLDRPLVIGMLGLAFPVFILLVTAQII